MKNSKSLLILPLLLLASCAGGEETGSSSTTYPISCTSSYMYEVTGLPKEARPGEAIYFDVEPTSIFYDIDSVNVIGAELDIFAGSYYFVMPSNEVSVSVVASEVGAYDDPDDNLTWGSAASFTISEASSADKDAEWDVVQQVPLAFGNGASPYITMVDITILTSDEDVIPVDAVSFVATYASQSSIVRGGYLEIDLKQVNEGTCYVYVELDPNNGDLGYLIGEFSVVPYGEVEVETIAVTLDIDNRSSTDISQIYVGLWDLGYVYGGPLEEYRVYHPVERGTTFAVEYAKGHSYRVSVGIDGTGTSLTLGDWTGTGSSSTGYNQLIDNVLTVLDSGVTVPLVIRD